AKCPMAKALGKREKALSEASRNINLNSSFKWDTFVLTLTDSNSGRVFNNMNMKQVIVYNAALFFGFTEEEIAGAQA
ncbi:Uncharacterized protein FKW44_021986, partial [Caligus rogercresseyi]